MESKNCSKSLEIWHNSVSLQKRDPNGPKNLCSIIPQPVLSKIFTSVIGNKLYQFAEKNGYVAHIETLTHIISNARLKQKGCVITLLDLKNAFDEVNHNLLIKTLKLHHIPDDAITLISSLYFNLIFQFSRTHPWLHRLKFIEAFYKATAYLRYFLISS